MANNNQDQYFNEASPSVQTHLGIMQATIERMANNSSSSKTWCITVVSAVLVVVADKGEPRLAFIALMPTFLFLALDTYYLALEKAFRESYNSFVRRLHEGELKPIDLYSVLPEGDISKHRRKALRSFSIWGFYTTLTVLIVLVWLLLL